MPGLTLSSGERWAVRGAAGIARSRRIAETAMLIGAACVLSVVESSLPPLAAPMPWLRVGLANVAVVTALAYGGLSMAAAVSIGRLVIVGLATGDLAGPGSVVAASGALCSLVVMGVLAHHRRVFTPVSWSAAGAAAHVLGQFAAAAALLGSTDVWRLAPPSGLLALPFGALVGAIASTVTSRLPHGRWPNG
jgi:heptaprenyl diphosphate synthase